MKKTKIRKEKPEVMSSVALVPVAFLAAESEIFFAFLDAYLTRFLLSIRKKSLTENFVNLKSCPLFVLQ